MKIESQVSSLRSQTPKLSYGDYLRFRDLVLERSGLYFPEKKKTSLEAGLLKALTVSPLDFTKAGNNLDAYYNLLRDKNDPAGKAEMERLIHTLTIGETHFFRDEPQFDALAAQVLPAIIDRKRAAAAAVDPKIQPQLRIWSAGCATGEEPFSLAILLKELLPDIDRWHILILATDINQDWPVPVRAFIPNGLFAKPEPRLCAHVFLLMPQRPNQGREQAATGCVMTFGQWSLLPCLTLLKTIIRRSTTIPSVWI